MLTVRCAIKQANTGMEYFTIALHSCSNVYDDNTVIFSVLPEYIRKKNIEEIIYHQASAEAKVSENEQTNR